VSNQTNNTYDNLHKTLTLPLAYDSTVLLGVGTPMTTLKMMPAFHTHRTFITSATCAKCKSKAFDPMASTSDRPGVAGPLGNLEYLFDHYGTERDGFAITGEPLNDIMCLLQQDSVTKNITPSVCSPNGVEFFSVWDYQHDQNMTLFQELPYDGLLGIGPSANPIQDQQSFTKTLFNSGLISNHSLTFRHVP